MKWYYLLSLYLTLNITYCNAQIVFKKTVSGNIINYPMKAYASDSTFKILFWNNVYDVSTLNKYGNIINHAQFGQFTNDTADIREGVSIGENGDFLFCGKSFFDNSWMASSQLLIINPDLTFKKNFYYNPIGLEMTNLASHAFYWDNYYYILGIGFDSLNNSKQYIVKLDTNGTITKQNIDLNNYGPIYFGYISRSIDGTKLYVGARNNVAANIVETYLLMEFDTSLNYIRNIDLPETLVDSFNVNSVHQINIEKDSTYTIIGSKNVFKMDKNMNLIKDINLTDKITMPWGGDFGKRIYKNSYENSYIISNDVQIMKLENESVAWLRDFANEPNFLNIVDVIPSIDSGYFVVAKISNGTFYAKLDCNGNYINPSSCWPLTLQDKVVSEIQILQNTDNWIVSFSNIFNTCEYQIINNLGQIINQGYSLKDNNSFIINKNSFGNGIYYLKLNIDNKEVRTFIIVK
jgi:hypothetical protein